MRSAPTAVITANLPLYYGAATTVLSTVVTNYSTTTILELMVGERLDCLLDCLSLYIKARAAISMLARGSNDGRLSTHRRY